MKRKIIFVFNLILIILFLFCAYLLWPVPYEIKYLNYELCTLTPIGAYFDLGKTVTGQMKNYEYLKIKFLLKDLKVIDEIKYEESGELQFTLINDEGEVIFDSSAFEQEGNSKDLEKTNIVCRKPRDIDLNVRYVINLKDKKNLNKLVIGHNSNMIMMNDKFYEISRDKYKKLIIFFSNIIGDNIEILN